MPAPNDPRLDWPLAEGTPGREIWYTLVAHPDRDLAFWYRFTLLSTASGHREGRLWAALTDRERPDRSCFTTRTLPPSAIESGVDPFVLVLGDAQQTDRGAHGHIPADGDDPEVSWQFGYSPDEEVFTPLWSPRLTHLLARVANTGKHWSANQSIRMTGTVRVDGQPIDFTDAPGHQGHTLSSSPPERVTWVNCNAFEDDDVVLEALNVGGTLSICLRRDGDTHHLNRLRDVAWRNRTTDLEPGTWSFTGQGQGVDLEATVEADRDHWQRVAYRAPDDSLRYNAHSTLSSVELSFETADDVRTVVSNRGRAEWIEAEPPIPGDYRPTWPE